MRCTVNLDLLEQAGLPSRAPGSFEEFVEFRKLTDPSRNLAAFGLGGASEAGNYSRLNALFWACGARIFGDDDRTVLVDTPEGIAAMERIVSLHRDLRITTASPIELGYTDMLRLFMNEQVAMIQANIVLLLLFRPVIPTWTSWCSADLGRLWNHPGRRSDHHDEHDKMPRMKHGGSFSTC